MATRKPYLEELKIEAVKQITERGHRMADVSARIAVSQHILYKRITAHAGPVSEKQLQASSTEELRRLKAELKRVTEESDILKIRPRTLPGDLCEVHARQSGLVVFRIMRISCRAATK